MLRLHIAFHVMEIHAVCQYSLRIIIHEIGHCSQSLCRCKRPDSPIPFTLTYAMRAEFRMTALGSGKSVRCGKAFLVHHFLPCHSVFGRSIRQIEIPRDIADSLAYLGGRISTHRFKEMVVCVPQLILYQRFNGIGFQSIFHGHALISCHDADKRKRFGIAIHITVNSGTGILLTTASADGFFHAILHISLPVKSIGQAVCLFPTGIFRFQVFYHIQQKLLVSIDHVTSQYRIRIPRAELSHFSHRASFVTPIPSMDNLIQVFRITQPAALINMMADGTSYQIVFIGIRTVYQKFGHTIAHRSFLDVLAQRPPTIIIHFLEVLLRALEKRNVFFHPLRCAGIGNSLGYILILHAVEIIHIGLEILIFQESRTGILISRSRLEMSYTIGAQRFLLTCIRQNTIPVCRGIHRRISPLRSGAEHHSLDGRNGRKEHTLPHFLSIHIDNYHAVGNRKLHFYLIRLARFILQQITKPRTSFGTEKSIGSQFQTGTGNAVFIQKFYLQKSFIVLFRHQFERYFQFFCSRYLTLHTGIIE